jgi:hypothetical protein
LVLVISLCAFSEVTISTNLKINKSR